MPLTNHYNLRGERGIFSPLTLAWALLLAVALMSTWTSAVAQSNGGNGNKNPPPAANEPDSSPLIIDTTSLPGTHPRAEYSVHLHAHGGAPPYQWKVETGELPAGLELERDGELHGAPERTGEFRFTISARDGSRPQQAVQREYSLNVVAAIEMRWKTPAHVSGSSIEGSVTVTNQTEDDMDFTFVVLAVADNGRATAIGYQHFPLRKGTTDFEIPFGQTLAHGAYVVHVDGVGEIADKNEIYRARLQTAALQVLVGP